MNPLVNTGGRLWEQIANIHAIIASVRLAFDEAKATQAAGLFLKLAQGSLNYMALIKLLYKADREAIRRWGLPITTDKYVSLKLGPVTSHIYDLIKSSGNPNTHPSFWATHIQHCPDPVKVSLVLDPGASELSRAEELLIAEIFAADGSKDPFALADECHEFPEWQDPGNSAIPINIAEIIRALDLTEQETARVMMLIEVQRAAAELAS